MKISEYNQMMSYLSDSFNPALTRSKVATLEQREGFAIGGGVIEGEDLGTREGFENPRKLKFKKPDLFNKIIELAEEGKTSVRKIGEDPEVVKLNNGKTINYGSIQRIITDEKGPKFFKNLTKLKQPFIGEIRKGALENLDSIMDDYYKGDSTITLTKKYFPNSKEAKAGKSATVLESVIKENIDPKKLKNRPVIIGSNQIGTRQEQIKTLKEFQDYLAKNINKFTSKSVMESNLKDLFQNSNTNTLRNFVFRANSLRKIYNDKTSPEGFKVNEKVKNLIKYLPAQDFVEEELRALGFSEKTIKSMNDVEYAVQKITDSSTMFEHALPRSLIRRFNLPKKFYLVGERTSNFLNKFKMQFDGQLKNAAEGYAQSDQSPADYKKYKTKVKEIRDKVRKYTGGYEIGYVDFDANGKAIPITPQSSLLEGKGELGKRTTGIKNFFKNMKFHNRLFENYKKNKNNPDFFTLNEEIKTSNIDFVPEYEIEKEYDKIKNFNKISQFQNYFKKVPDSNFFKSLFTGRGGKGALAAATVTGAVSLPTLLAAQEIEPGQLPQGSPGQINQEKSFVEENPILTGAAVATSPLATKKGRRAYGALARPLLKTIGSVPMSAFLAGRELSKDDPNYSIAGLDLLLPELGKRVPGSGSGILAKVGRFAVNPIGRLARGFTPAGIALQGVELVNQALKEQRRIEDMRENNPEAYQEFLADQEDILRQSAAYGGRIGFADGPDDPKKRSTMKILGGLASLPIVGRFFELAQIAAPVAEKAMDVASEAPPYFFNLVDKIRTLGQKFAGPKERSESYIYKDYEMDIDLDTGKIDIKKTKEAMIPGGDEAGIAEEVYMTYKPGMTDETTGGRKFVEEYDEYTARPDIDGKMKDVEDGVPDDILEDAGMKDFKK